MEERRGYRILVALEEDRPALIRLALALARQKGGEVVLLQVVEAGEGQDFGQAVQWGEAQGVPVHTLTKKAGRVSEGILTEAKEGGYDLILLSWRGRAASRRATLSRVVDPVVQNAPCDVAVVRGEEWPTLRRILVPTAGGPHAKAAAELALVLAKEGQARVTALYICRPGATEEDVKEGEERIAETFAGLDTDDLVEAKVKIASGVVQGTLEEAEEHDLVLFGASEESLFDQILFGSIPERVASQSTKTVLVVKRYPGRARSWLYRLWRSLFDLFPTLTEEERLAIYRTVRRRVRPDIDYFLMTSLASIIATLGLLMNSAAIIIGAMLVAPLMTPILAISFGIAHGDIRLLRHALESALKGVLLAIGLAALLALVSPLTPLTPEILARTRPTLLDLIVALASGAAGAYAMARKDVSEALPGVAISAALVPPLGVMGIGLATGSPHVAGGAFLLFSTNLTAISLIGSLTFLLLGFRPAAERREGRLHLQQGLVISLVLFLLVSLPLAFVFARTVRQDLEGKAISRALATEMEALEGVSLAGFDFEDEGERVSITVTIYAAEPLSPQASERLSMVASEAIGRPVHLRLVTLPVVEVESFVGE